MRCLLGDVIMRLPPMTLVHWVENDIYLCIFVNHMDHPILPCSPVRMRGLTCESIVVLRSILHTRTGNHLPDLRGLSAHVGSLLP